MTLIQFSSFLRFLYLFFLFPIFSMNFAIIYNLMIYNLPLTVKPAMWLVLDSNQCFYAPVAYPRIPIIYERCIVSILILPVLRGAKVNLFSKLPKNNQCFLNFYFSKSSAFHLIPSRQS